MFKIWLQYDLQCNYRLRSTSFILYIFWHLLLLHKLSLLFNYDKSSSNIKQLVFLSFALWTTFFGIQFKNVSKTKKRRTFWHNLFHAIILFFIFHHENLFCEYGHIMNNYELPSLFDGLWHLKRNSWLAVWDIFGVFNPRNKRYDLSTCI